MKAEQLRKSILQLAIQGKLVPQDPNDEPASVLLERIHAEKQRLIKEGKIKKDKNDSVIFKGDDNRYYEKVGKEIVCIDEEVADFDIPDSWTWLRLSTVCSLIGGYAFKSYKFSLNGVRVIRISDFDENGIKDKDIKRYTFSNELSQYKLIINDIIMCMTGGTVGKSLLVKSLYQKNRILINT